MLLLMSRFIDRKTVSPFREWKRFLSLQGRKIFSTDYLTLNLLVAITILAPTHGVLWFMCCFLSPRFRWVLFHHLRMSSRNRYACFMPSNMMVRWIWNGCPKWCMLTSSFSSPFLISNIQHTFDNSWRAREWKSSKDDSQADSWVWRTWPVESSSRRTDVRCIEGKARIDREGRALGEIGRSNGPNGKWGGRLSSKVLTTTQQV